MNELLANNDENQYAKDFCNAFIHSQKTKYIFGINQYAGAICSQIDINGFIDDFTDRTEHLGKPIYRLAQIPQDALILSTSTMRPLSAQARLNDHGAPHLDYFAFYKYSGLDLTPITFWENYEDEFQTHKSEFEYIYSLMSDKVSSETYRNLVNFKLSCDLSFLSGFKDLQNKQYFEDFLQFHDEGEVFADIGGYDGYTTKEFISKCPNYQQILFFEPFADNMAIAKINLADYNNINYYSCALSSQDGSLYLSPEGSATRVGNEGLIKIDTVKLDNITKEKITFLKIDVEGAESQVIEGANRTILEHHPKIAIAAYHKASDFWKIPQQILAIRADYDIYIRHYTEGKDETVLFFIPRNAA